MKQLALALCLSGIIAAVTTAQCPVTSPAFDNNTSLNAVELNIAAPFDGTANSLFTPGAQDNKATLGAGDPFSITLSNPSGFAGAPLGIFFANGGPVGPLTIPSLSDVYLSPANPVSAVVDGTGLVRNDSFANHPGGGFLYAVFGTVPNSPFLNNVCLTFQAVIQDPANPPFNVRVSNAIALGLRPNLVQISPNFAPEGGVVAVVDSGTGNGNAYVSTFNPAGAALPPTSVSPVVAGSIVVPFGSESGPVAYEDAAGLGNISDVDADEIRYHLAVISPFGTAPLGGGLVTLTQSPSNTLEFWSTTTATLVNATAIDLYTLPVLAGDIVHVEVYSMDVNFTRVLDGLGANFNPGALEGFDPAVEISHTTNVDALMFGGTTGAAGAIGAHGDEDGGPGFNARATFQSHSNDNLQIAVRSYFPAAYVTGDYMLNIRVLRGAPAVSGFTIGGLAKSNIAAAGSIVTVDGTFDPMGAYAVNLRPRHGLYGTVQVIATTLSATQITFIVPAIAAPLFQTGAHDVSVTNLATGETSLNWPTNYFGQFNGPKSDLLVVTAPVLTAHAGNPTIVPGTTTLRNVNATANFGLFFQFAATAGQTVVIECHGIDSGSMTRRTDSGTNFSGALGTNGAVGGVYNPHLTLFAPGFVPIIAQNDDNGIFPVPYNWVDGGTAGIGRNASLIYTTPFTGTHLVLLTQNILFGNAPYEEIAQMAIF